MSKDYWVYILSSKSRILYIGVTSNLSRRIFEHQNNLIPGFTTNYQVKQLVYFYRFDNPEEAIAAEKQLKGWRREKKVSLILESNPLWLDLSEQLEPDPS